MEGKRYKGEFKREAVKQVVGYVLRRLTSHNENG